MAKERHYRMVGEESARQKRERLRKAQERLEAAKAKRDLDRRRERYMRCSMVVGAVLGLGIGAAIVFGGEGEVKWIDVVMGMLMCMLLMGGAIVVFLMMAWFVAHPSDTDNEYYRSSSSSSGVEWGRLSNWYMRGRLRNQMRKASRW